MTPLKNTKRAFVSLIRQPFKAGIFLVVIIILGTLATGAVLVHHAITNTNQNLRGNMPGIAVIKYDFGLEEALHIFDETGVWPDIEVEEINFELIHEIGDLPQVKMFDYSLNLFHGIVAPNLVAWQSPVGYQNDLQWHYRMMSNSYGVELSVSGTSDVNFLEIRSDFVDLIQGRGFTEEELLLENADFYPVLVSSGFAEANQLMLGSTFEVGTLVHDTIQNNDGSAVIDWNSEPTLDVTFELTIIGIFNPILTEGEGEGQPREVIESRVMHRLYVPRPLTELMSNSLSVGDEQWGTIQTLFLLNDPLDFEGFNTAVTELPGNWMAIDYSRGFGDITTAMVHLNDIANIILVSTIVATVVIVGLVVLLSLSDRKHEIGIYLALGSKKLGIIYQIVLELTILTVVGITISLFVGNMMANQLSHEMLIQKLENPSNDSELLDTHWLAEFGYQFHLTEDEMLDSFDLTIDMQTIVLIYVGGIMTVLLSTFVPIAKTVRTNPKKVLI